MKDLCGMERLIFEQLKLQQQGRATAGYRILLNGQQDCGSVFDGAAVAEPGGQRDAAGGLRRQVGKIEDDQSEAATLEQKISSAQDLFQTVLRLPRGFFF